MSDYQPREGDWVRVVIEGEVESAGKAGFTIKPGYRIYNDEVEVVSVEKVAPPLPTTPGSVVRSIPNSIAHHSYFMRTGTTWVRDDGESWPHLSPSSFEVIFDAGEVTP